MPVAAKGRLVKSCPTCHDLDRGKIFYWKEGPSRHRMFKRYYGSSDYHTLRVALNDLKFSASRECPFCVIVFDIFRWLTRTKSDGPRSVFQPKVEICIHFTKNYPIVLSYSWLPAAGAPIAREYDFQLGVPQKCHHLPWSTLTVGQQVPQDPRTVVHKAASWLQTCLRDHSNRLCGDRQNGSPRSMPKRLLYIGEPQNQIRLVECGEKDFQYMALSYCWGTGQHLKTTQGNYNQHLSKVSWSLAPKTLKDAVEFTRALGYSYIWIDSLCIVQDNRDEWYHEASCMGDIYKNAVLVISAAQANHAGFGCFIERQGSRTFRNKLQRQPNDPTHVLIHEPNTHTNLISSPRPEHEWPVFRRAWTLQERLLATRIVHFTAGELVWECATTSACECGHMDQIQASTARMRFTAPRISHASADTLVQNWDELVLSYQNRVLTEETDRLSALSGLAQQFQSSGLGDYIAGVWTKYALSMMLWEVKSGKRTSKYVAPSWSYASVQGRLLRNDKLESNAAFAAKVEDIGSTLTSLDPFGAISDAFVVINTPACEGIITNRGRHGHAMVEFGDDISAFFVSDLPIQSTEIGSKIKCAFLRGLRPGPSDRYIEAIVLKLAHMMNAYERIGIAHLTKHSLEHLNSFRLMEESIKIV